jgi:hypothetical protein
MMKISKKKIISLLQKERVWACNCYYDNYIFEPRTLKIITFSLNKYLVVTMDVIQFKIITFSLNKYLVVTMDVIQFKIID